MIQLANAPCSWGILEPFGARNVAGDVGLPGSQATAGGQGPAEDPSAFIHSGGPPLTAARFLNEVASSGYVGTELGDWGFLPTDATTLHDELAARGLSLAGAFVPVALARADAHDEGLATAVQIARLMREVFEREGEPTHLPPVVVLSDDNCAVPLRCERAGRITPADGLGDHQWTVFARGADRIAHAVRNETGLLTVFHGHCGGYVETASEIATLLDRTDPGLVGLCLDTGHLTYGGADVLQTLAAHARRVWHVHVKDCSADVARRARTERWDYVTAIRHGLFCELGRGSVPFDAVMAALSAADYQGWLVVEQDVLPGMGTPLACAQRNREYLHRMGI